MDTSPRVGKYIFPIIRQVVLSLSDKLQVEIDKFMSRFL
jgi:hypothetical protein